MAPRRALLPLQLACCALLILLVITSASISPPNQTDGAPPGPPSPPQQDQDQQLDCSLGCNSTWQPVCASDGLTYGNPCLAQCQGLSLQSNTPCPDDTLSAAWAHVDPGAGAQAQPLPRDRLGRFAAEDFRYAARVKLFNASASSSTSTTTAAAGNQNSTSAGGGSPPPAAASASPPPEQQEQQQPATAPSFVRVTRDGDLYVASASDADFLAAAAAAAEQASAPGAGGGGDGLRRSRPSRSLLAVLGADSRISCPRYPTYPFSAVGQILARDSSGLFVCTGTLIGPDVVLTAAHCVYNRKSAAFLSLLDFLPARYRSSYSDSILSPYGAFPWTHVTLYSNYLDPGTADPNVWDIAVVKLPARVGDKAGWMGLAVPCAAGVNNSETWTLTTAGYPVDKAAGSCLTTQCSVTQDSCTSAYLYHMCDTYEGQSGSAMWAMDVNAQLGPWSGRRFAPYVRAVHNLEWTKQVPTADGGTAYAAYTNSAVAITPLHYAAIKAWIASAFKDGDPETLPTWYPLPSTMMVTTSLSVSDTAVANVTSMDAYTYSAFIPSPAPSPNPPAPSPPSPPQPDSPASPGAPAPPS